MIIEECGADVNAHDDAFLCRKNDTAVINAARNNPDIVKYLVKDFGADLGIPGDNVEFALKIEIQSGNLELVKFLLVLQRQSVRIYA